MTRYLEFFAAIREIGWREAAELEAGIEEATPLEASKRVTPRN